MPILSSQAPAGNYNMLTFSNLNRVSGPTNESTGPPLGASQMDRSSSIRVFGSGLTPKASRPSTSSRTVHGKMDFHARLLDRGMPELNSEQLWRLTEARVVIEDWRWKYNNVRPHCPLGYFSSIRFAQKEIEERASTQCWASRRPSIGFLYNLNHIFNPPGLTKAVVQFR